MAKLLVTGALAAAGLWGCAASAPPAPPAAPAAPAPSGTSASQARYRCDDGVEFTVRFVDDTAVVEAGARGSEVLLRDAGGVTPQQTVYSNAHMRAEFGLGVNGREAVLHYSQGPLVVHCARD